MAKMITYRKRGRRLSQLASWKDEEQVHVLQMKKSPDGKKRRDHLAAEKLGLKVSKFTVVTKKGNGFIWGIKGEPEKLLKLMDQIGRAAYQIVKAEGGGKQQDRPLKERWHFVT